MVTVKWVHVCNNPTATASCHLETTKFGPSSAFKFPLEKFLWINLFDRRMKSWPAAVLEISFMHYMLCLNPRLTNTSTNCFYVHYQGALMLVGGQTSLQEKCHIGGLSSDMVQVEGWRSGEVEEKKGISFIPPFLLNEWRNSDIVVG